LITPESVTRFLKLWQKNQPELTHNLKVAIFKVLCSRMLDGECLLINVSGKHVRGFGSGVYIPEKNNIMRIQGDNNLMWPV
jgi:hypothetical protein